MRTRGTESLKPSTRKTRSKTLRTKNKLKLEENEVSNSLSDCGRHLKSSTKKTRSKTSGKKLKLKVEESEVVSNSLSDYKMHSIPIKQEGIANNSKESSK
jgi:hypothetical protein